jgi:hypothetical protein
MFITIGLLFFVIMFLLQGLGDKEDYSVYDMSDVYNNNDKE